jgi:hypothetical protein
VPPRQLQSRTPKDLETICLKCLRKDPARRYQSALALAEDLRHFLAGEPIQARPVGRLERAGRWCRRYPAVTTLIVILILFCAVIGYLFGQAIALKEREAEARQAAETALGQETRAKEAADQALKQESQAKGAADRALADLKAEKQQTTDLLYATRINLAHREWQAGNARRARQLLDDCPQDLRGWEWGFLKGLFDERSVALNGHAGMPLGVALTPDGNRAVTIATDHAVRIWDARTGAELHKLDVQALRLAVSPDGRRAAVAVDQGVKVFDLATGRDVYTVNLGDTACGLGFVRGAELAVALLGGQVRFLDAATGAERSRLGSPLLFAQATRVLLAQAQGVAFSPDGRWLAQGGT